MPIIDIRYVDAPRAQGRVPSAQELADALGRALGSAPGRTWVRLDALPRAHYAENGVELDDGALPLFVTVLLAHLPDPDARASQLAAITASVAACFGRPTDRVHVEYAPPGAGRMAFGGHWVE